MSPLKLTEIWIYPVKSLGGIRVNRAVVLKKGLQFDRRYMLVGKDNQFITQRTVHELALFKLSLTAGGFLVSFKGDSIKLPFEPESKSHQEKVTIWRDEVKACELGQPFNEWFAGKLGFECKLVYFPEENERQVDKNFVNGNEQVSFADGYPYLIIGQSSLDDINSRMDVPVPMNRFRPNFVFEGGLPFAEDKWVDFKIGENRFRGVKLCERCNLPTINQETGKSGTEPLATLAKYRKMGSKILFGQNLIASDFQTVREGDFIHVDSYHS